ncbi:MAG: hypothetical protein QXH24_02450 [Candidatus Bathyarchaeia archaeon]
MKMKIYVLIRRAVAGAIALINLVSSIIVIFNPLSFIMFLPVGLTPS